MLDRVEYPILSQRHFNASVSTFLDTKKVLASILVEKNKQNVGGFPFFFKLFFLDRLFKYKSTDYPKSKLVFVLNVDLDKIKALE